MATMLDNAATTSEYAEMARRPLDPEQCALVVIDIQEKLLPPIFQKEQLVRNSQLLIRAAGILKIPALVSTQYAKGLGGTVPEIASLLSGTEAVDKTLFSCFGSDAFCSLLKRLPGQRTTLLLCGMESHICVTQTALGALREGYLVHVASDAVSSRTEWNWKIGLGADARRRSDPLVHRNDHLRTDALLVVCGVQGTSAASEGIVSNG